MGSTERSDIDTLRERLDALEARHRRMYRAVTAAAVAVVATLALGAARKHRVEADEIVVRDEAGTVRLRLGMSIPRNRLSWAAGSGLDQPNRRH